MKSTKLILTALITLLIVSTSFAGIGLRAGANFSLAVPQEEYKENVDNLGFGFRGNFGYNFEDTPFIIGADFNYLIMGNETREEPFSTTIPDVTVDVTTTNSNFLGHLFIRIQPQKGFLRPYIDGLYGFNYLATTTKIEDQNDWDDDYDDDVASTTNQEDFTSNYGIGGGLMFRVYDGRHDETQPLDGVFVDFGFQYLNGGQAEYLKEGSIERKNGKVYYDTVESKTDMITWHLGVSFNF